MIRINVAPYQFFYQGLFVGGFNGTLATSIGNLAVWTNKLPLIEARA